MMKVHYFMLVLAAALFTAPVFGQMENSERKSPPATVSEKIGDATITINYSQPSVKGREIFGGLVPYEKVWRTGANEATTFETDKDLSINGEKLKAGKYALFTIPGEKEWVIIFNSNAGQWGAYDYKEGEDVLRIKAKAAKNEATEKMTFTINKDGMIYLDWAETRVPLMVKS